jgi:ubiquinone/menaquinone biosynthesis C-methylase UbiE
MIMENEKTWKQFKGKETPSSVEINKLFYNNIPKGSEILDFGCAWGRIAFHLQKRGFNVTGFDLNKNAVETALKEAVKTNKKYIFQVQFHTANAMKLPYPDKSFDACILQAFLTTIIKPEHRTLVLKEANRILKDDGILYLADFGQNWENPYYSQRYERDFPKTGEMGTFIVTKNGKPNGKELFKAHHYTRKELMELFERVKKFKVDIVHETVLTTFQGNQTKGYIIIAKKI